MKSAHDFRTKRCMQSEAGTSSIEFAIVVTLFLSVIFGVIVYGSYFGAQAALNHVAYEAARASLGGLDDAERTSLATARANTLVASLAALLNEDSVQVTVAATGSGALSVTVSQEFDALGLTGLTTFLPMPPETQTAYAEAGYGGY